MSTRLSYRCDGCGEPVDEATAIQFAGIHAGQTTVASGGVHAWHSCGAKCAAQHLRDLADKVEARGEELRREREAYEKDLAKRKAEQAKLRAAQGAGPGTR